MKLDNSTIPVCREPAHVVDVRVFVEVVAVLADVVQLGVERGVVLAPARPPVSLTEMSIRVIRIIPKQALIIILITVSCTLPLPIIPYS